MWFGGAVSRAWDGTRITGLGHRGSLLRSYTPWDVRREHTAKEPQAP
ncbi:hypothetical protein STAFG_2685 [Streptomyces afghaniensis 772]|uniref:Uncharacterized protein n=1 Tax=Streptomyces afghaniensis 772 TaxID=1283301 RepID=S4NPI3_9ACTN|nr:hypothetical protein STAFG_2685 [Streptomyces afghaniensis 772]